MTEPIIINGIDVSGCEYFEYGMCTAERNCDGYTDIECKSDSENCYYKQLQRKTEECEKIRKDNGELFNKALECRKENTQLQVRCDELNTKLQIIMEALKKVINCEEGLPTAK